MAKLNARQKMFIDEYLVDLNSTQAAIRAGYSPKTAGSMGSENLKKPEIHARVEEGKKTRADKLNLDAYWVLKRLMDISDRSMQAEQVMEFDYEAKELVPTGEYQFDSNGANRSTELIGKHLGMFKDRVEVDVQVIPVFKDSYGDEYD